MEQTPKQLWDECREIIRQNILPEQYNALFAYTEFKSYADGKLVLSIPSQFIFDMLERDEYINLVGATLRRVFGHQVALGYSIPVVKSGRKDSTIEVEPSGKSTTTNGVSNRPANVMPDVVITPSAQDLDSQLHKGYLFENYIEGTNNRLARSVGEAIAQQPAKTFNPLFIYGPSGCGKTHLVNAIGWRIKQLHPQMRVLYLSAHLFYVQYSDAVRQNKVPDFIKFYQTIDVLIIDDTQEFSGKTSTQNTFFHIFNHLHLNGKQIILTADRPPVKIDGLEDRLLTRFKWGLQAEIEKPTKELRYKILQSKIRRDGLNIPDKVVNYIADNIDESVRDLEGIITSLMAHSVAYDCEITLELVQKMMPRYVDVQEIKTTISDVINVVTDYFKTSEDVICSRSRKQEIVYMRQLAIYLSSKHTEQSTVQIGNRLGGRNHATVIHSINQIRNLIDTDEKTRQDIKELEIRMKI